MTIDLRTAVVADVTRLKEIEQLSFADPSWEPQDFLRYDCIVAEVANRVEGFIVSRIVVAEREILNLAVDPAWRRRGVATILLTYQLTMGGTYYLEVRESNLAAQALYRKCGFEEVGRRPSYYDLPTESAIVMRMK
ncbi:MAG: ribosomal protein S18-alanine N-acetyltransferase [Bryobacteraceae bacterium]